MPGPVTALNGHNASRLVTLTANDGHGNTSQCSFTVTLKDDTAPVPICKNGTTHLDNNGVAVIGYGLVYQSGTDNCGSVNLESISKTLFNCANLGPNTVTVTVNDGNGNKGTCTAMVTVVDNIAPSVVCKPFTTYLNDAGTASIVPNDVYQSGADNCSSVNLSSVSPSTFNCANLGANTVLLTINDGHGNNATCSTTVTVIDNLVPKVVCKSFTAYLNAAGVVTVTPADVFQSGTDNCGIVNLGAVSPSNFNCTKLGSNDVTLVVNDGHGNSNSCNTFVNVKDAIIPTMLCKNATLYLNSAGEANLQLAQVENGSFDNCGITFMGLSQTLFTCDNLGANTVVLGGRDQSQNKGQCTASITVLDNVAPVTKCKNLVANLDANGSLKVTTTAINNGSFDNCTFTQTLTPNTFSCSNVGINNAVLRSTDVSGNTTTCTALITVNDLTAPTAICKNATIYVNDVGQATLNTSHINNNSTDACGIASMVRAKRNNCSDIPGSSQTVILTLKDVNNNQSSCSAQVTTKDNLAPTAVCNNVTVQLGENGKATVSGSVLAINIHMQ